MRLQHWRTIARGMASLGLALVAILLTGGALSRELGRGGMEQTGVIALPPVSTLYRGPAISTPAARPRMPWATGETLLPSGIVAPAMAMEKQPAVEAAVAELCKGGEDDRRAEAAALSCLDRWPESLACLGALGILSLRRSDFDEVRPVLDELKRRSPADVDTLVIGAEVSLHDGQSGEACASFKRACELGQSFACGRSDLVCEDHRG